jgi:hypothetical protein
MQTAPPARRRQPRQAIKYAENDMGQVANQEGMSVLVVVRLLSAICFGQDLKGTSGTWKMNAARSTFAGRAPFRSLIVRIERHPKGEVFTLERIEIDGRTTSYSTILYLDGEPRRFEDFGCSGIQSSRRADERAVEIVRMCASGAWMWLLRRASATANELVLEITEQSADGRRFDRLLTLEGTKARAESGSAPK